MPPLWIYIRSQPQGKVCETCQPHPQHRTPQYLLLQREIVCYICLGLQTICNGPMLSQGATTLPTKYDDRSYSRNPIATQRHLRNVAAPSSSEYFIPSASPVRRFECAIRRYATVSPILYRLTLAAQLSRATSRSRLLSPCGMRAQIFWFIPRTSELCGMVT